MEGEQKHVIPLDSPLDINSNDMLVPVSSPKFSFNRQRYLGSVLQNSVRYEADGWFAGWWVHNFDFITVGKLIVDPDDMGELQMLDVSIPGASANKYWYAKFIELGIDFRFIENTYVQWLEGGPTGQGIMRTGEDNVHVQGYTSSNPPNTFEVDIDPYTGLMKPGSYVTSDPDLLLTAWSAGGTYHVKVAKPFAIGQDFVYIRYGENATIQGGSYTYSFDGTTHKWSSGTDTFTYDGTAIALQSPSYNLDSWTVVNPGLENEVFNVVISSVGTFNVTSLAGMDLRAGLLKFTSWGQFMSGLSELVDLGSRNATAQDLVNINKQIAITKFNATTNVLDPYSTAEVGQRWPIWVNFMQDFTFEFSAEIGQRFPATTQDGGTDPATGDPITIETPASYELTLYLKVGRENKRCMLQDTIDNTDTTAWTLRFLNYTWTEADIDAMTAPIKLYDKVNSADVPTEFDIALNCRNILDDAGFPVPLDHQYFTNNGTLNDWLLTFTNSLSPTTTPVLHAHIDCLFSTV